MSTIFSVKGVPITEFLICKTPCNEDCTEPCLNEKKEVRLLEEVSFQLPENKTLTIKPGFIFDGASIPQICWTTIGHPLEHCFIYASLLHDALYVSQYLPRKTADLYFHEFLKEFAGVSSYTAWKMYTGVRLFGSSAWNEKTPEQIALSKKLIILEEYEA